MRKKLAKVVAVLGAGALSLSLGACGAGTGASGASGTAGADAYPTKLILADQQPVGDFNPVGGYCDAGVCPLYDGLLRPLPASDTQPAGLEPALAAAMPEPSQNGLAWSVKLRSGVTFSDGSPLTPADVVATYESILADAVASPLAEKLSMVTGVRETAPDTVEFALSQPFADFPTRLMFGIVPARSVEAGVPCGKWQLNSKPVGTGAYELTKLEVGERADFTARQGYFRGTSPVKELTILTVPEDNTRVQWLQSGEIDGAQLPPRLAETFKDQPGYTVVAANSVDWRGLTLPSSNPFTADPQVRLALNYAIDRDAIVRDILRGYGEPAYTPVNRYYGTVNVPDAFPFDLSRARELLAQAGWEKRGDTLEKDGQGAQLTIWYPAGDEVRGDLAKAVGAQLEKLGVGVEIESSSWDDVVKGEHLRDVAAMFGGGDYPYSVDTQLYATLHTPGPRASIFDNPTRQSVPGADVLLDSARITPEANARTAIYRQVVEAYVREPSYLMIAFMRHAYVTKTNSYQGQELALEPHEHGVGWGPWWNLAQWHK